MNMDCLNMHVHPISLERNLPSQIIQVESSFEHKETTFLGIKQKPQGNYRLRIINLNVGNLILEKGKEHKLVEILCNNKQGSDIVVELKDYKTSFTLILNPSIVMDYNQNLSTIADEGLMTKVCFKLELTKEGQKKGNLSSEISIPVKIEKPEIKLDCSFALDDSAIEYDPKQTEKVQIGYLNIKHGLGLNCVPELASEFMLRVESDGDSIQDFITLDFEDIQESNPVCNDGTVVVAGLSTSVLSSKKNVKIGNKVSYQLKHIRSCNPSNVISIPLMMDMTRIVNPKDDVQIYRIILSGVYNYKMLQANHSNAIPASAMVSLKIEKNRQLNVLKVYASANDENELELESGATYPWGKISLSRDLALVNDCKIRLSNTAIVQDTAHPHACILIENLKQISFNCEESRITLADNGKVTEYFRLKDVQGNLISDTSCRLYPLQTAKGNVFEFGLAIESDAIEDIKRSEDGSFATQASTTFEFDYAVDLDGDHTIAELEKQHFKGTVVWSMEQVANPEWLSVDFGTSAIVASFASDIDKSHNPLLNLKAHKNEILRRTYGAGHARVKDDTLEPEPFIPSVISFNSISNANAYNLARTDKDFKEYPVWLSPSTGMMDIMLPCLKSLIGYKTIPNFLTDAERNAFVYQLEDASSTHLFNEEGKVVPKGLAYVNTILEEVYKQLFRHYICMNARDEQNPNPVKVDELHKLVLSVPNTFTPKHHALLKDIAKSFFPMLHPEYLQVVSESDAVACYYLARRNDFYHTADFLTPERKHELDEKERVLVFDMGAGTLDLTYFEKTTHEGKTNINMKGKMGMNKAGNYLDYLLAEILCDLLNRVKDIREEDKRLFKERLEIDLKQRRIQNTSKRDCEDLKRFVRDVVKPLLNQDNQAIPTFEEVYRFVEDGKPMTMKDIKSHPKYKEYIKECTEDVLDNLMSLFAESDDTDFYMNQQERSFPIDVLVFSGRSTTLLDIRHSVSNYIQNLNNDNEVLCADLNTLKLSPISQIGAVQRNVNSLKTVVTFGSLIYADWINRPNLFAFEGKKVFADYGVLIKHVVKGWEWYPLITNRSKEIYSVANPFVVPVLFESDNFYYPIDEAKEIIFVQSYSKNPADDWQEGKKDLITEIVHFDVPDGASGNQKISIEIDANNTITCKIQQFGKITLEPHDDFQNESLRKSLWPVVF